MAAAAVVPPIPELTTPVREPVAVPTQPVVLYDGECGLCAKVVRFILGHERDHELRFAPLQGETAAALRGKYPEIPPNLSTVVLVADGKFYIRSKAVLHLAKHFRAPWSWLYAVRWFPRVLGDLGYRAIARIRYGVWGKVDACELPSPANRARFLP